MRTYVINLESRPDRWQAFCANNNHLGPIYQHKACIAAATNHKFTESRNWTSEIGGPLRPHAYAQIASHLTLWDTIDPTDPPMIIAEDDALFHPSAPLVIESLPMDPADDWDLIALGVNHACPLQMLEPGGWLEHRAYFVQPSGREWQTRYMNSEFAPNLHRLVAASGTTAYILNPRSVAKIRKLLLPIYARPMQFAEENATWKVDNIDSALCRIYPRLEAYCLWPPIAVNDDDKFWGDPKEAPVPSSAT
jgi:glycosyl transferase, family 25